MAEEKEGTGLVDVGGGAATSVVGTGLVATGLGAYANREAYKKADHANRAVEKAHEALHGTPARDGAKGEPGLHQKAADIVKKLNEPIVSGKVPEGVLTQAERDLLDIHTAGTASTKEDIAKLEAHAKTITGTEEAAVNGRKAITDLVGKLKPAHELETQIANAETHLADVTKNAEGWKNARWSRIIEKPWAGYKSMSTGMKFVVPVAIALGGTMAINAWRNSGKPEVTKGEHSVSA